MTCKDCIHYGKCHYDVYFDEDEQFQHHSNVEKVCEGYDDKSLYIKLPCSTGDKIYSIVGMKIDECVIRRFEFRKPNYNSDMKIYLVTDCGVIMAEKIGTTVFFTREEAEQVVKTKVNK